MDTLSPKKKKSIPLSSQSIVTAESQTTHPEFRTLPEEYGNSSVTPTIPGRSGLLPESRGSKATCYLLSCRVMTLSPSLSSSRPREHKHHARVLTQNVDHWRASWERAVLGASSNMTMSVTSDDDCDSHYPLSDMEEGYRVRVHSQPRLATVQNRQYYFLSDVPVHVVTRGDVLVEVTRVANALTTGACPVSPVLERTLLQRRPTEKDCPELEVGHGA